eukprot:TRINITY_DN2054_c0_g1_i1.p1 TRINITY_DN2054_c0_g1~~TRINITY_DN2054_c0_g1_i1.p1  ORF type:complete len:429 (-),score=56.32 TRINITY_DN2054_c0_g1_i1:1873-3159(-)
MSFEDFIRVEGVKMFEGDKPFYFLGANCYYLMTFAAEGGVQLSIADETLVAAKEMGITVLRIWAYSEGPPKSWQPTLQPSPGVYSEQVFEGLDYVLHKCKSLNIRLILCLNNYWNVFGGMVQYVKWSNPKLSEPQAEQFYDSAYCQKYFRKFIKTIIQRKNSITKTQYMNDSTIMAWEICNEPQFKGAKQDTTLSNWIGETSQYIKTLDSRHLVTVGDEGFFDASSPAYEYCTPKYAKKLGTDFIVNGSHKGIDFLSLHMYPNQWLPKTDCFQDMLQFARVYIDAHTTAAKQMGKPLVLAEFGFSSSRPIHKYEYFTSIFQQIYWNIMGDKDSPLHGSMFWVLCAPQYPDYGGYAIYPPKQQRKGENPYNILTSVAIVIFAKLFNQLAELIQNQNGNQRVRSQFRERIVSFVRRYFMCCLEQQPASVK